LPHSCAQELGLRDAAVIYAWVIQPREEPPPPPARPAVDAADGEAVPVLALPSIHHRNYPRTRATLSPSDLVKASRVHLDTDPSFEEQGEIMPNGLEAS
jgi:hypothetical protein